MKNIRLRKLMYLGILIGALGLGAVNLALATPSTQIWNPFTDIQGVKSLHLGIDNYYSVKDNLDYSYASPTYVGLTYGLFKFMEIGVDLAYPSEYPAYFNAGSTFSAHQLRISVIAVNTNLAAAAGAAMALLLVYFKTKKWDVGMMLNGCLAGLVAITASCAWVQAWSAVVIGLVAGVLVVVSVYFWERMGVDDPVGAVSVHAVNGVWGLLSIGLFADGTYGLGTTAEPLVRGLFYGGTVEVMAS